MGKKCLICSGVAEYAIKDTSDFYCKECAEEQFGDLSLLVKIEENNSKKAADNFEEDEDCDRCDGNCDDCSGEDSSKENSSDSKSDDDM